MPLRMGQVNQIYYCPVLWYSSVEAGKGDIIGMEERLCNWDGVHADIPLDSEAPPSMTLLHIPTVHHSSKDCHKQLINVNCN